MTSAPPSHVAHHSHVGSHGHSAHEHASASDASLHDLLDLDADVLHDYWTTALGLVRRVAGNTYRARILDLGAGTGTGAIGLAQRFIGTHVVAVDISSDSLRRVRERALDLGLASRVSTQEADLDAGWPAVGSVDLTWASMSLHHLADPALTLRQIRAATNPGGLIAVVEFPEPMRFLPDDLGIGDPGFEARVTAALDHAHAEAMPTLGTAWGPRLESAGWTLLAEHDLRVDLSAPQDPNAGRYAHAWFTRLSQGLEDRIDPVDQPLLEALIDPYGPHSLLHRTDLHIRGIRTLTIASRS